ncbi:MAG: D-glycero-beta-D-manno-heptose 1-phosphate adenylyltransferase [Chloroflexota bacterium]
MSPPLAARLSGFAGQHVVVVGEAMLDAYLHGRVDRLSREAPVPVVAVGQVVDAPGGAANAAANVTALGGRATLVSVRGDDAEGVRLDQAMSAESVDRGGVVVDPGRTTLAKQRVVAMDQMLLRFDTGTTERLPEAIDRELVARIEANVPSADAIVISDYDYGVVSEAVRDAIARCRRPGQPLIVDARDLRRYRTLRPTAVKPNYAEATRLLAQPEERNPARRREQMLAHGPRLLDETGAEVVALTVDRDGAMLFERDQTPYRTYARPRPHARAAGAGDTFVAALALGFAAGASAPIATELASAAAAVVVGKDGTSTCTADELRALLTLGGKRLEGADRIRQIVDFQRRQGHRIVFTNGCFDILHRGHITYLNRAKALGDLLIVAVNDDAGVARLKGPSRPINSLDDRLGVLEALSCVDHVVAFEEEIPARLIEAIRPDVYVKGGDYDVANLPEAPLVESLGGVVQILPYVEDRSTSGVIERVRASLAEAARS